MLTSVPTTTRKAKQPANRPSRLQANEQQLCQLRQAYVTCNSCGSSESKLVGKGPDFEYDTSDQEFPVVKCANCGLVYLNPRPHVSELPAIYPDNYLAYDLTACDNQTSSSLGFKLRRRFYTSKIKHALTFLPEMGGRKIDFLDIGAGDGRLLNWYKSIPGHAINTHAVEMNARAAQALHEQEHNVYQGVFEDTTLPNAAFDIVHSSHVIEHVADPTGFASKGYRILRPGGLFLVETPNIDCVGADLFRSRYWGGYHFPRHWTFYSPETLTNVLSDAGLDVLDIRFFPNPVFWVWTFHHMAKEKGWPEFIQRQLPAIDIFKNSIGNVVRLGLFTFVERALGIIRKGRMGSMFIIARKPVTNNEN